MKACLGLSSLTRSVCKFNQRVGVPDFWSTSTALPPNTMHDIRTWISLEPELCGTRQSADSRKRDNTFPPHTPTQPRQIYVPLACSRGGSCSIFATVHFCSGNGNILLERSLSDETGTKLIKSCEYVGYDNTMTPCCSNDWLLHPRVRCTSRFQSLGCTGSRGCPSFQTANVSGPKHTCVGAQIFVDGSGNANRARFP